MREARDASRVITVEFPALSRGQSLWARAVPRLAQAYLRAIKWGIPIASTKCIWKRGPMAVSAFSTLWTRVPTVFREPKSRSAMRGRVACNRNGEQALKARLSPGRPATLTAAQPKRLVQWRLRGITGFSIKFWTSTRVAWPIDKFR